MTTHRTDYNPILGGAPEIQRLFNDRVRLVFRCKFTDNQNGWFADNIGSRWGDFGSLMDAEIFVDGESKGWESLSGLAYDDARLIGMDVKYLSSGEYITEFIYETLTDTYAQETAEKVDYELNGLRRVTRSLIAIEGSTYGKEIEVSTIVHEALGYGSATLNLGIAEEYQKKPSEGGFTRITEVWYEYGILRKGEDPTLLGAIKKSTTFLGPEQAVIGPVEGRTIDNFEGLPTTTVWHWTDENGNDINGTSISYDTTRDFTLPGVVGVTTDSNIGGAFINYMLATVPPRTIPVECTITVTYTTSSSIATDFNNLYIPEDNVSVQISGIGQNSRPFSVTRNFNGYYINGVDDYTFTTSTQPVDESTIYLLQGERLFGGTRGTFEFRGNSKTFNYPTGSETIALDLSPAFTSADGVQYYKKTKVVADLPSTAPSV